MPPIKILDFQNIVLKRLEFFSFNSAYLTYINPMIIVIDGGLNSPSL